MAIYDALFVGGPAAGQVRPVEATLNAIRLPDFPEAPGVYRQVKIRREEIDGEVRECQRWEYHWDETYR